MSALEWVMMRLCRNRLFEWIAALILIGLGGKLVLHPGLIEHSTFRVMLQLITPVGLAWLLLILGLLRATTLAVDGQYRRDLTPQLRALLAGIAAVIWGQMGLALEMIAYQSGASTIGSPVYFGLMLGELFSCYRSLARDGNGR